MVFGFKYPTAITPTASKHQDPVGDRRLHHQRLLRRSLYSRDLAIFYPLRSTHYLLKKVFSDSKYHVYSTHFVPQFRDASGAVYLLSDLAIFTRRRATLGPIARPRDPPDGFTPTVHIRTQRRLRSRLFTLGLGNFSPTSKHTLPPKKGFLGFQVPHLFYTFCPAI